MFMIHTDDGRGKYPEIVTTRVPSELRQAIKQIADAEHVSMQEVIRRAIREQVERKAGTQGDYSSAAAE